MNTIITDLSLLRNSAQPVKFLTDKGIEKDETLEIVNKLKEVLTANKNLLALAAPQIGIDARIIAIKFNDIIKFFINPIITKKSNYSVGVETFESMPGKEIFITRPKEITIVYYTDEFKYEENKLLDSAAWIFDQHAQLLDGLLPEDLGLVSDIEQDGSLNDLTDEEFNEVAEFYKQYINTKIASLKEDINKDEELRSQYRKLDFSEKVITGQASVIAKDRTKEANKVAALSLKNMQQIDKAQKRAELHSFLRKNKSKRTKKGGK